MSLPKDDVLNRQSKEMRETIAMTMAGRIAEEIVTGESPPERPATSSRPPTRPGHGHPVGHERQTRHGALWRQRRLRFLGKEISQNKTYSEQTAQQIDTEVRRLIDEGYKLAKSLIEENRDKLDLIANALLE
ncbi:MAG: hypothetical protein CM1200mP29_02910 [Verrucomicrobiota bacterium]|nr:MAG: hypothetical protein CM1200mP29_02910 [Verrucomicrobiota bacterium]